MSRSRTREVIAGLFEKNEKRAAFVHRFAKCCRATDCGHLCERLVKGPGKADVWCADLTSGKKILLYPALEDSTFRCPEGLF